ncbi:MAG: ATP-binding cassette domain-containing protein [Nitrososphaera sp.]
MEVLLETRNLKKYFPVKKSMWQIFKKDGQQDIKAVDDVSISLERGKVFVIAGESGSGKTTLARLVMGAEKPDSGSVIFDGSDMSKLDHKELRAIRTRVQMIYQDPYSSLDPRLKIMDAVMEPLDVHDKGSSKQQKTEKVMNALEEVRLKQSDIAGKFPHMLSGGQRQRVAIARSLVLRPKLIVADEPVSMLDVSVRGEILSLMQSLKERFQISFVYITHDLSTARYLGDEIAIMHTGKIVECGPIDDVLSNPRHTYTKALIDAIPDPDLCNNKVV